MGLEPLWSRESDTACGVCRQKSGVDRDIEHLAKDGEAALHARGSKSLREQVYPRLDLFVGDLDEPSLSELGQHVVIEHHPVSCSRRGAVSRARLPPRLDDRFDARATPHGHHETATRGVTSRLCDRIESFLSGRVGPESHLPAEMRDPGLPSSTQAPNRTRCRPTHGERAYYAPEKRSHLAFARRAQNDLQPT